MYYHKVKTSLYFSMILELQKQRDIDGKAKNTDVTWPSVPAALLSKLFKFAEPQFPLREIGMRTPALRGWSGH